MAVSASSRSSSCRSSDTRLRLPRRRLSLTCLAVVVILGTCWMTCAITTRRRRIATTVLLNDRETKILFLRQSTSFVPSWRTSSLRASVASKATTTATTSATAADDSTQPLHLQNQTFYEHSEDRPAGNNDQNHVNNNPQPQQQQVNDEKDDEMATRLFLGLAGNGMLGPLEGILKVRPDLVHATDRNGWTALHEAARGGHLTVIQFLVQQKGANPNVVHSKGGTPLYEAEKYHGPNAPVVQFLQSHVASLKAPRLLLRRKGQNDKEGNHANNISNKSASSVSFHPHLAHALASLGLVDELHALVHQEGMGVLSIRDENGWTPLHEAARAGHEFMAQYLLHHGADGSARTFSYGGGATPLDIAQEHHGIQSPIYQLLLQEAHQK